MRRGRYLLSIPPPAGIDPALGPDFLLAVEKKRDENVKAMLSDCERRCKPLSKSQYTIVVGDPVLLPHRSASCCGSPSGAAAALLP